MAAKSSSSICPRKLARGRRPLWMAAVADFLDCKHVASKPGTTGAAERNAPTAGLSWRVVDKHPDCIQREFVGHGQIQAVVAIEVPHGNEAAARREVPRRLEAAVSIAHENDDAAADHRQVLHPVPIEVSQ